MTPRVRQYVAEAAMLHGVAPDAVLAPYGRKPVRAARKRVILALRGDGFTVSTIGRWLGRDHSTIVAALRDAR